MSDQKMLRCGIGATLAIALIAGLGTVSPTAAQTVTMKVGMVTINDPIHTYATKFAQEVEKRSNGRIKSEVYPAGQLGKAARQIENLQFGTQEVFISPPGFLAGINPAFQVIDAPGLFRDMDHAHKIVTRPAFRAAFLDFAKSRGIVGTSLWVYGPTVVAATKPIKTVEQLKGLKVRILASDIERATADVMGMAGIPLDFTETLPALQNGTIDACRSSLVVMGGMKFFSSVKNVLRDNTGMIFAGTWVSKGWLDGLPKDLQQVVLDVGKEMDAWGTDNSKQFEAASEKMWTDAGAVIATPTPEQQKALFAGTAGIGDRLLGGNAKTAEAWKALQAAAKEVPAN